MMPIALVQSFDLSHCSVCGIAYAVPEGFEAQRRVDGKTFWCPNGHTQVYRITEVMRLRSQLESQRAATLQAENRERVIAEQLKRSEAAKRKLSKRLEAGVCPVAGCKRHFTNLQRHIMTKHAGTAISATEGENLLATPAPRQIEASHANPS